MLLASSLAAQAAKLQTVIGFTNPDSLTMQKYIPDGIGAQAPLVVVLHGCQQNGPEYYEKTGWKKMADRYKFALLVPSQKSANNQNSCFNWFEQGDSTRGRGESASIVNAMDVVITDHALDRSRVFVTGVSAGGAMTGALLANYPDRFKSGATHAGVVYGCGTNMISGLTCMSNAGNKTAQQYGDAVRSAGSNYAGAGWPTIQIWHGTADQYVAPAHLDAFVKQWTNVHGIDQTADVATTGGNASIKRYYNAQGKPLVESYAINGMKHGVAINPGSADEQCGVAAEYYFDNDVCHPFVAAKFWGIITSADDGFEGGNTGTSTTTSSTTTTSSGATTTTTTATTTTTTLPAGSACHVTNNVDQVAANRAYVRYGMAYANGSKQPLGFCSKWVISKLRNINPGYYVIDLSCR